MTRLVGPRARRFVPLLALAACLAAHPVGAAPAEELQFHDPSIVRDGDTYYVFSTGRGVLVRRSTDLEHWEDLGPVFERVPPAARRVVPNQPDLWAPDVAFFGDTWHLYYAISRFGSNRSAIGHATTPALDPASEKHHWTDKGLVLESTPGRTDYNAIDPNVAFDEDGRPWLFWGSFMTGIKVARLDARTGELPRGARIRAVASRPAPGAVEAAYVVRKGDAYFLFLSFDFCCRGANSDYRIVVGRSKRIDGPYVDRGGRALLAGGGTPVLSGYGRWRGPGHNSVLLRDEGDLLVHHAYDANRGGRHYLRVRPLVWAPDGWPLAGEPEDRARWAAERDPPSAAGAWMHSVDFQVPERIALREGGVLGDADSPRRWAQDGRRLALTWPAAAAPGGAWVDECVLSADGCRYLGRNQQGTVVRGWRLAD